MLVKTPFSSDAVQEISGALNHLLADLHIIYAHLHTLHWNVEGKHFFILHHELQKMYEHTQETIDDAAERILMIGTRPVNTLQEYVQLSSLTELESKAYNAQEVGNLVLQDIQHLAAAFRRLIITAQQHNDEGTADFAVELLRTYEKQQWFWSAYQE